MIWFKRAEFRIVFLVWRFVWYIQEARSEKREENENENENEAQIEIETQIDVKGKAEAEIESKRKENSSSSYFFSCQTLACNNKLKDLYRKIVSTRFQSLMS